MSLDLNPHLLSAKTQDYPLGYRGNYDYFIQISNNRTTISNGLFTKNHEDWVKVIEYSYVSGQFWQTITALS